MTLTTADYPSLRLLGWPWMQANPDWSALLASYPDARLGRIVQHHRSAYRVAFSIDSSVLARAPTHWQSARHLEACNATVGDWVLIKDDQIVVRLPRWSHMKRAAAGEHYQQQCIAANIATALILCGLDRDFNMRRMARYRLMALSGGVKPVILLTKADQCTQIQRRIEQAKADCVDATTPVLALDTRDPQSVSQLCPWLTLGKTLVVVGSSGVGKSSLTNTLMGHSSMRTGRVRPHDGRGRHTTTGRTLVALPAGACLIDTPGMRELKPTGEERLETEFSDILLYARHCRFRDCKHKTEPDCAVRHAVQTGQIAQGRLQDFHKIHRNIADTLKTMTTGRASQGLAKSQRRLRKL